MTTDPVQAPHCSCGGRRCWARCHDTPLQGDERIACRLACGFIGPRGAATNGGDVDLALVARMRTCRRGPSSAARVQPFVRCWCDRCPNAPPVVPTSVSPTPLAICRCGRLGPLAAVDARLPNYARVLIERAALPPAAEPHAALIQHSRAADPQAVHGLVADPLDFTVAMVPVAAKYIARGQPQQAAELLRLLDRDASNALGVREQLSALRRILQRAERTRPSAAVQAAAAVLDLTEQLADR